MHSAQKPSYLFRSREDYQDVCEYLEGNRRRHGTAKDEVIFPDCVS